MKISFNVLLVTLGVLVLAHALISVYHNRGLAGGDYFSSGIIVMSDGKVLSTAQRLYSDGKELYSYDQVGLQHYELHFSRVPSIKGNIVYVNRPGSSMINAKLADRDLSFNSSYVSRAGSKLTMSEIQTPFPAKCLYIYELSSVHCYGAKRADVN